MANKGENMKEEIIYNENNENNEGRVVKIYLRFKDEKFGEQLPIRPIVSFILGIEISQDAVEWNGKICKNKVEQEDAFVMLGQEYEEFLNELKTKKKNKKLKIEDGLQDTDSFVSLKVLDKNKVRVKASFRTYVCEPFPSVNVEFDVPDFVLDNLYKALTKHTQF